MGGATVAGSEQEAGIDPVLAQHAVEAMPAALAVIGQDGRVVATNDAWPSEGGASLGEPLAASGAADAALPRGGAVATRVDVTRSHEVLDLVAASAVRDPLTGLPHRTLIEDRIAIAIARAERGAATPALLFLDLDGFKAVNDDHGHEVGDQVLVTVGRRLDAVLRASDTCGRWGGDEFVVVVDLEPSRVDDDLGLVISRICATVDTPINVDGLEVEVGLSLGAVLVRPDDTIEQLTALADDAMYQAKRAGSCSVVVDRDVIDLRPVRST
jgi:diguanylate cyclase (GGDEF)-like protein